jgi:UDP-2-acetamido-3-amino-2,3-dideoxy-glucuronate N-acetyltransferase
LTPIALAIRSTPIARKIGATATARAMAERSGAHVFADGSLAKDVTLGPGAVVHAGVTIGPGSAVGACAVVHSGTVLGARCLVEDNAVLGKRPRLRPGSSARGDTGDLVVEDDVTICTGAVVYAGARIGAGSIIGDQAHVRERSVIGAGVVIGRGSTVDFDTRVGDRVSIQTLVYLTALSVVEDDVFIGPGVTSTNDDSMGRHPRGSGLAGPILRRACRIGGGAVLTPGIEIGTEAFVAAGAVVTGDVESRAVVMGVPARIVRRVSDEDLLERWR